MKYFITLLVFFGFILCQQYQDVIYLKNGSEIRGIIIEQSPNEYIKIRSGSNIFVYEMDKIEKFTKEEIIKEEPLLNKNFSVSLGALDDTYNLLSIRNDFLLDKNNNLYGSIGFGFGLNWVFAGLKYEPNYNQTGFSSMLSGGAWIDSWGDLQLMGQLSASYQHRFDESANFFNIGFTAGLWIDTWYGDIYPMLAPVISFTTHF